MTLKKKKIDLLKSQIERLYSNYGIDITDMEEEEYIRIINSYQNNSNKLLKDIKDSEKHRDKLTDDDII